MEKKKISGAPSLKSRGMKTTAKSGAKPVGVPEALALETDAQVDMAKGNDGSKKPMSPPASGKKAPGA